MIKKCAQSDYDKKFKAFTLFHKGVRLDNRCRKFECTRRGNLSIMSSCTYWNIIQQIHHSRLSALFYASSVCIRSFCFLRTVRAKIERYAVHMPIRYVFLFRRHSCVAAVVDAIHLIICSCVNFVQMLCFDHIYAFIFAFFRSCAYFISSFRFLAF